MKLNASVSKYFIFLCVLLAPLPACSGHPAQYSAEAIEAWVVDAETKEPLADVIVVANWQLYIGRIDGRHPSGQLMVMETVTDQGGHFSFPAWGPMRRPFNTFLDDRDPQILLFKPSYEFRGLSNPTKSYVNKRSVRRSIWDGKAIELNRFGGGMNEYARRLGFLMTSLGFIEEDCNWKKVPKILLALRPEQEKLRKKGIIRTFYSPDYLPVDEDKCGSVKEFFQGYQP